jgi:arylsulfatase/uncharacterized sulfatase
MKHATTRSTIGRAAGWLALLGILLYGRASRAETAPPARRPNIVMVMVDDAGLTDFSAFGGEAHMPTIDSLAAQGTMFTRYHTSPLCSPSRAMFVTGIDNHRTGLATIEEVLPPEQEGQRGYTMHLEPGVLTVATRLKAAGYRTYMSGKWHLGDGPGDLPDAHGFDRSLALAASCADNWEQKQTIPYYDRAPWFEDGKPTTLPKRFYSSELIVDRLLGYLRSGDDSGQPFFAYLSFQAIHIPVQAPRTFTDHYAGRYDGGWEQLRRARWERAQQLGLIPTGAPLKPVPDGLRRWASLSPQEQRIYARAMAVEAGMLEAMDQQIGRLVDYLKQRGEFENTIFVVTSDNGPEPSDPVHTRGMGPWMAWYGYDWQFDNLGEPGSLNFIGTEWATATASPGWLFKFYVSEGGIHVPLIISGPGVKPGTRAAALAFVTDVTPTLLDLADVPVADGPGVVTITGKSLRSLLEGDPAPVHGPDEGVGVEVSGNSALFLGDHKLLRNASRWGDGEWHLYDLARDPGETDDLIHKQPERATKLMAEYNTYARKMGVLPMPAGYEVSRQITINSIKRHLRRDGWALLAIVAVVLGLVTFGLTRWRRRRG